jgi:hypothetical protein
MDASVNIRKDRPSLMRSLTSLSPWATMCIENQGDHFKQLPH